MADLLADENFPLPVVEELRRLGHNVKTWTETGLANIRYVDPLVLQWAVRDGRALLTLNRKDFVRLHAESDEHEGIIACTQDLDFQGQAQRIHEAIVAEAPIRGKLIRINRPA